jgi:hypothetical protein
LRGSVVLGDHRDVDPLFEAHPSEEEIGDALRLWPELSGKKVRPLLVSAFGDIFVETDAGDVWVASPIELTCEPVAKSVDDLKRLFADPTWAEPRLLTEVALLARDQGVERPRHRVFAIAPHPCFTGSILAGKLMPTDLAIWHHIASQIREPTGQPGGGSQG